MAAIIYTYIPGQGTDVIMDEGMGGGGGRKYVERRV